MTLAEIEKLDCDFLTVKQVAECLKCDPQLVRDEASKTPKYLGFPITKIGHSFRVPREGFLNWSKGLVPVIQVVSSNEMFHSYEMSNL